MVRLFLHVCIPLLVAVALYAWFRTGDFQFLKICPLPFRGCFADCLPVWITGSLPDCLWLYSFMTWMRHGNSWGGWVAAAIAIGSECLQGLHYAGGTFDLIDLFAYAAAIIANICFFRSPPSFS